MLQLFYDGACPVCVREVAFLRRRDRDRALTFVDISATTFDAGVHGREPAAFTAEVQGLRADGSWVQGVEAFRQAYEAIGFRRLVAISRWPLVGFLLRVGYRLLARNRGWLFGRIESRSATHAATPNHPSRSRNETGDLR